MSRLIILSFLATIFIAVAVEGHKYRVYPSKAEGLAQTRRNQSEEEFVFGLFPDDFLWGLATSSYQIEGGWNVDGKGLNIWDTFSHSDDGGHIADRSNGDVAADSYNLYEEDTQILQDMHAHFYRFSLSWSRIFPDGTKESFNQAGVDYYNRLIDALIAKGLIPMVTLYHWDLPQSLMDLGGWPNEELVNHYADYARTCFEHFGDRVKHWITFNEPYVFIQLGYNYGSHAPGLTVNPATVPYQCAHNVIKAHARAYRIYEAEFKAEQNGVVGITLDAGWSEPSDRSIPADVEASDRAMRFHYGWFAHPLTHGEYPPVMREIIDAKSAAEGLPESRLPSFDAEWTQIIKGTLDFYGLNHYSTSYVYGTEGGAPGHDGDQNVGNWIDPSWPVSGAPWLYVVPWGFREVLKWIGKEYNNAPIYVTENGYADHFSVGTSDPERLDYYKLYINEMLKAVTVDGVNVKGYTAWSLLDNYEWAAGYTQRFGVHYVDLYGGNLTRVPKDSAKYLTQLFQDNGFPEPK